MNIRRRYFLTVFISVALLAAGTFGTLRGIREVRELVGKAFAFDGLVEDLLTLRGLTLEYEAHASPRIETQWMLKYGQISATFASTPGIPPEVQEALVNLDRLFQRVSRQHPPSTEVEDPLLDRLRDQIVTSLNTESSRIVDWLKDISSDSRDQLLKRVESYSLAAIALLCLLAALSGWILLSTERRIVNGVSALREGAEAVGRGDLEHRIDLKGSDEFAALASTFNTMTEELGQQAVLEARLAQSQKLEAMGTLAGGIAHDFNNLLSGITGFTEMAMWKLSPNSPARADLQDVMRASRRAADLVRQILAFCRMGSGEARPLRPRPIIAEALRLLRASIPTTVEIRSDLQADPPIVADPGEIHRIIVNLCTNAFLAMRDRGGLLEISLREKVLEEPSTPDPGDPAPGRYLCLVVSDTGTGIPPEVRDRIFDPFFTTRATGEGTGMGLSVIHGIVKKRGGTISVQTQPGMGTTFTILLPVTEEAPQEEAASAETEMGAGSILVVDDDLLAATLLERQLTQLGYRVRTFTGSPAALAAFGQDPAAFDLVVTDLTMHGMTGDVLAFRLRGLRPDIPILLVSAFVDSTSSEKAKALGVNAILAKPFSMADLSQTVHRLLSEA